jgi:hypothetical protein
VFLLILLHCLGDEPLQQLDGIDRLFVPQGQGRIHPTAVEHRQDMELCCEVGIVSTHIN